MGGTKAVGLTCIEGTLSLLDFAEDTLRRRLIDSPLSALAPDEKVADLFCGAGGWGEGARELGIHVDYAVNHDAVAIAAHEANNPWCRHHRGDAWRTRPRDVIGRGTKLGLLLASAACTTHSRARGSAPISKRVHMLGWCIARWMEEVQPRIVLIENVPEWQDWGPTLEREDGTRTQDPARKGQHFRRWWRYCVRLGYVMEKRVLDAPDYGAASRRRRLFIIARRDGQPIVWPEKTHESQAKAERCGIRAEDGSDTANPRPKEGRTGALAKGHSGGAIRQAQAGSARSSVGAEEEGPPHGGSRSHRRGQFRHDDRGCQRSARDRPERLPHRTAAECIDWSDLGSSIFERSRPLRPKTLARICEGVRRYVLNDPQPFVLRVTQSHGQGGGWHVAPVDEPLRTQTTRQDLAVATPILAPQNTDVYGQRPDGPAPTVTTKGHQSLITPILATTGYGERYGQAARVGQVADLLGTCVNGVKQAVVSPVLQAFRGNAAPQTPQSPLPTITAGNGPGRGAGAGHSLGVISPVLMNNTTHHTGGRVDGVLPTVTTGGQAGLVAPVMAYLNHGGKQSGTVCEPLRTVVGGGNHAMLVAALMMEYYGSSTTCRRPDGSLGAVTTLDRHGLVSCVIDGQEFVIVDILFRMLRPRELAKAMGFRDDYAWPKTQRDTVRLIGNAVAPPQARALIASVLPNGRGGREEARATA